MIFCLFKSVFLWFLSHIRCFRQIFKLIFLWCSAIFKNLIIPQIVLSTINHAHLNFRILWFLFFWLWYSIICNFFIFIHFRLLIMWTFLMTFINLNNSFINMSNIEFCFLIHQRVLHKNIQISKTCCYFDYVKVRLNSLLSFKIKLCQFFMFFPKPFDATIQQWILNR